jgi:hypothetical protein
MIDDFIKQNLGGQQESYYFQLIPLALTLVNKKSELPPPDTTYRFAVLKGNRSER